MHSSALSTLLFAPSAFAAPWVPNQTSGNNHVTASAVGDIHLRNTPAKLVMPPNWPTSMLVCSAPAATQAPHKNKIRTAPATDLIIRRWNTTTFDCNLANPHLWEDMGPVEDPWGDAGSYDSYSLSRNLAANETLVLYSPSGELNCGTELYSVPSTMKGYYQTDGRSEIFLCMKMVTSS